jgi:hypothetical protein
MHLILKLYDEGSTNRNEAYQLLRNTVWPPSGSRMQAGSRHGYIRGHDGGIPRMDHTVLYDTLRNLLVMS